MSVGQPIGPDDDLRMAGGRSRAGLRAAWLVRIRWGAFAAQVLAIGAAALYLAFDIPTVRLLSLSALTAATNVALEYRLRRGGTLPDGLAGGILCLDVLVLTGLLYLAGGPSNPFSVFFLVQITIAAVILGSHWTWLLAVLSVVCYAALFLLPHPALDMGHRVHGEWTYSFHLEGMGVALSAGAALTAYFVTRLSRAIEARDAEIAAMHEAAARQERLSAVTTLAAGAAHELGTPMSTIALTARELEHALERMPGPQVRSLLDDARLIRSEVDRCRLILQHMAPAGSSDIGEVPTRFTGEHLVADAIGHLSAADAARVRIVDEAGGIQIRAPRRALVFAVVSLLQNAVDASAAPGPVTFALRVRQHTLDVTVQDAGHGMSGEVLAHAGEPFFPTKPPGQGMGLGLFLARAFADRIGGRLTLASSPAAGTSATLEIPLSAVVHDEGAATL